MEIISNLFTGISSLTLIIIYLVIILTPSLFWGFATRIIIKNKGYNTNWFWWGFFFHSIAFVIALCRKNRFLPNMHDFYINFKKESDDYYKSEMLKGGGWVCECGTVNAPTTTSCHCGKSKPE